MRTVSKEVKDIYETLWNEVSLVSFKWHTFKDLFSVSDEQLRLLENTANGFFHICESTLLSDVLVSLSRLTDKPKSNKGARITLRRLLLAPELQANLKARNSIGKLVVQAEQNCDGIRQMRNHLLGHLSLNATLSPQLNRPAEVTVDQLDQALKSVQAVISGFADFVFDEDHRFDISIMAGGVTALINHLKRAVKGFDEDSERALKR